MKLTEHCHQLLLPYLSSAKFVVDATIGNGLDTLFLCSKVPSTCQVFGFDIQEVAISKTKLLLEKEGHQNFTLSQNSHANMQSILMKHHVPSIDLAMFNLGYLPHGDKKITTTERETIPALTQAFEYLKEAGVLSILIYPGHPEGEVEALAVNKWLEKMTVQFHSYQLSHLPSKANSPYLVLLHKSPRIRLAHSG